MLIFLLSLLFISIGSYRFGVFAVRSNYSGYAPFWIGSALGVGIGLAFLSNTTAQMLALDVMPITFYGDNAHNLLVLGASMIIVNLWIFAGSFRHAESRMPPAHSS